MKHTSNLFEADRCINTLAVIELKRAVMAYYEDGVRFDGTGPLIPFGGESVCLAGVEIEDGMPYVRLVDRQDRVSRCPATQLSVRALVTILDWFPETEGAKDCSTPGLEQTLGLFCGTLKQIINNQKAK
jgi:hypothetical protein